MSDANPHRGEVSLKLGEREVTLRPTFAALVAIERETGMGLLMVLGKIRSGSIEHLPVLVREGARAAGHEVTPEEVEASIAAQGVLPVLNAVNQFVTGALTGGSLEKNGDAAEATTR